MAAGFFPLSSFLSWSQLNVYCSFLRPCFLSPSIQPKLEEQSSVLATTFMMFDSEAGKLVPNTSSPFTTHSGDDVSLWPTAMLALEGLMAVAHIHVSRLLLRASGLPSNGPLTHLQPYPLLCYSILSASH